jgi:hypothetical protein
MEPSRAYQRQASSAPIHGKCCRVARKVSWPEANEASTVGFIVRRIFRPMLGPAD